jgi:hypothetical protein
MSSILLACGGFLLAVLWMDLMFDVQVLPHRGSRSPLPEAVLASIAGYYRRVTTEAWPMNRAIAAVMMLALGSLLVQVFHTGGSRWIALLSLALCSGSVALVPRVLRNAMRLGARADTVDVQSQLARNICRDHLVCLAGIVAFLLLQLSAR